MHPECLVWGRVSDFQGLSFTFKGLLSSRGVDLHPFCGTKSPAYFQRLTFSSPKILDKKVPDLQLQPLVGFARNLLGLGLNLLRIS